MAQSVWVATPHPNGGLKLVDLTGNPLAAAALGGMLPGSHITQNGVGAIVEAVRVAAANGRRVVSVTLIQLELAIVVE